MKNVFVKFLPLIYLILISNSCINKKDKIDQFIYNFNLDALKYDESEVLSAKAKRGKDNSISIIIKLNRESDQYSKQIFDNMYSKYFADIIYSMNNVKTMMDEGLEFDFFLFDKNEDLILTKVFDKNNIQRNQEDLIGAIKKDELDLEKSIKLINTIFPVIDKANKISILEIKLINGTESVMLYEVESDLIELLNKDKKYIEMLKKGLLYKSDMGSKVNELFDLGLTKFYIKIVNPKRSIEKIIDITKEDIDRYQ